MGDEKLGSANDSEPVATSADSRTKKIVKYSIAFGLVWFIVHPWFINPLNYIFVGNRTTACTHGKYAWVLDAFAPKEPQVPRGRLAENFFLYVFLLIPTHLPSQPCHIAPYRTRPVQSQPLANMRRSPTLQVRNGT